MIVISVLIGVTMGRGTARVAILEEPYAWWRAWLYLFLISGTALAIFLFFVSGTDSDFYTLIGSSWAISFVVSVAAVLHIRFGSAGMLKTQSSTVKRWLMGFFHSTAPFTIACTIGLIASVSRGDTGQLFGVGLLAGALWSLVVYAWSTSLVESALQDAADLTDRLRLLGSRFSNPAAVAAVATLAISYLMVFGPNSIPIFAETAKVDASGITVEPHSLSLHLVPNVAFFKFELPLNSPRVYDTSGSLPDYIDLRIGNALLRGCFYLPSGKLLGNVSAHQFNGGWTGKRINLNFRAVPTLDGRTVPATDKYQYALVSLQKDTSKDSPEWIAQITGQLTPNGDSALEIVPLVQSTGYIEPIFAMTGILKASGNGLRNMAAARIPLIESIQRPVSRLMRFPSPYVSNGTDDTEQSLIASVSERRFARLGIV
jgi:hypothetical protein